MRRFILLIIIIVVGYDAMLSQIITRESSSYLPPTFYKLPVYNLEEIHFREKPPLQKGRIAGQLAGGALAGLVTGTAFVLIVPCYDLDCNHPFVLNYTFGMSQAV
jgi:hypothetical protein